jgi:predicted kinase
MWYKLSLEVGEPAFDATGQLTSKPHEKQKKYPEWNPMSMGKEKVKPMWFEGIVPFEAAKEWVRQKGIKTFEQWKSIIKPPQIPENPVIVYKTKWKGWADFFGVGAAIDYTKKKYTVTYEEAKQWAIDNHITNIAQWYSAIKPPEIPSNPDEKYKHKFKSWEDFFDPMSGTQNVVTPVRETVRQPVKQQTKVAPINEVMKWIRQQGIKTLQEYQSLDKPHNFPKDPDIYSAWKGWRQFQMASNFNLYKYSQSKKILYIMRGLPGSGKSTLAQQLGQGGVVFSTDDFFMKGNQYVFDPKMLGKNHASNYARTVEAMKRGISPIVVDNTSVQLWTMKNYVLAGQKYGYQIEFKEPQTEWTWNANELAKRNTHKVPLKSIEKMIQQYEPNASIEEILKSKNPNENNVD